jgi:hypothetical protein
MCPVTACQGRWWYGLGPLGVARILFGLMALFRTTPALAWLHVSYLRSVAPLQGWPTGGWHVAAFGLALPAAVVASLCIARTVALVLFTAGVRARESGVVAALLGWAVMTQDALAYVNTLHLLCLGLVVLALGGGGSTCALLPDPEVDPPSARTLVQALVVSVYGWSGVAKLNASWLSGHALASFRETGSIAGPLADVVASSLGSIRAASWSIAVTELAIGPLLLWKRTRTAALAVALVFHAVVEIAVHPDFFGFAMGILLVAFAPGSGVTGTQTTPPSQPATR